MRAIGRSIIVAILALVSTVVLGVTSTLTLAVALAATRALIVPGTGTPNPALVPNYMPNAVNYYLVPGGDCAGGCTPVPVPYIAQFWPIPGWGGLSGAKWNVSVQSGVTSLTTTYNDELLQHPGDDITVFGYSQGATVTSIVKGNLDNPVNKDQLNIFFIGNPQRPNGGFFERWAVLGTVPILDATFGNPTPTDTCEHSDGGHCLTDFALQYDGVVDFPAFPIDFLADLNAIAGIEYVHGTYLAPDDGDPPTETPYGYTPQEVKDSIAAAEADCTAATHCQQHGDSIYITLPARTLPIMQPFLDLAAKTGTSALVIPIVDLVSPAMQTLIELGYDRTDYGQPTPARLIPRINPVTLTTDLIQDLSEGIHAALHPGLDPLPGSVSTVSTAEITPADTTALTTTKPKQLAEQTVTTLTTAGTTPADATALTATTATQLSDRTPLSRLGTAGTRTDTPEVATTTPQLVPERGPLARLSAIARPNQGITVPEPTSTSTPQRPSLRVPIGTNVRPDSTKSLVGAVRNALGTGDKAGSTRQNAGSKSPKASTGASGSSTGASGSSTGASGSAG